MPQAVRDLTHVFAYNDLNSLRAVLQAHHGQFAAVVLEPMNVAFPEAGFLQGVQALAQQHGALLVFDETITGFRFANGGAQALFGVTPDLATFGKGLANGYPVSAVAGRRDLMRLMEEIFFSFTFGGETLSLAAARATLTKLQREPVTATLASRGQRLIDGAASLLQAHGLQDIFSVSGHPSWSFLNIRDARGATAFDIKTLWMQEMHQQGFLSVGTHNMSYAHSDADVDALLRAYDSVLPEIGRTLDAQGLQAALRCTPLVPLFKLR